MKVLLAVTGGIAAYKTPELVRRLREAGHDVRCVVTATAARMVAIDTLAVLSGHRVHQDLWGEDGDLPHIDLARWCDCLLVAPATADCLARLALGLAGDLLGTLFLALEPETPVLLAPAMNVVMWEKPVVQRHLATLQDWGAEIVDPVPGELACGEEGLGAMAGVPRLVEAVDELAAR